MTLNAVKQVPTPDVLDFWCIPFVVIHLISTVLSPHKSQNITKFKVI